MFKKILIATDLSASCDAVVNCTKEFKYLGAEEVILFYATGVRHLIPLGDFDKRAVEPILIRQQRMIELQGFKTTINIEPGLPSEELKKAAKRMDVSLIIIGSHGESADNDMLSRFGGVATEILHSHEKPLLLVRNRVVEKDGGEKVEGLCGNFKKRILFATDFSDISMGAFNYVEKLVENGCKNVTLLHVQDKVRIKKHLPKELEEFNRIDTERLEMCKELLKNKGAKDVEIKIVYGIPSKEILNESKNGYSLIVMGSQGRGFFHEIFIGSVSQNVARNADVSLLLIPSKSR